MLRWKLEFEEYGPELIYIQGNDSVVADALTRLPIETARHSAHVVATSTVEDAELFSLVPTSIKDEQVKASLKPTEDVRMREISGVNLLTTVKDGRIVVSLPLQPAIMRTYHE
ncbi:hypothetical protein GN244_ATG01137 [Phytophthora infestans]|uniref:Uncharacterized protein n=1 Tax=Phytophthora infestans TaxID=4787 RepID=A0A833X2J2_PHYIN|nr:hypothetical protein GN244_ATG01137 [Phytophthora infestans]